MEPSANSPRPIDQNVADLQHTLRNRFAYVSKARANIWLTTGITLFVAGAALSSVFVYYNGQSSQSGASGPQAFTETGPQIKGPTAPQTGVSNAYVFEAVAAVGQVRYHIEWGDGSVPEQAVIDSSMPLILDHAYTLPGDYIIRAAAAQLSDETVSPEAALHITVSDQTAGSAEPLLVVTAAAASPTSRRVTAGTADVSLTTVDVAAVSDITLTSVTLTARGDTAALGTVSVYAGDVLLGTGAFNGAATARIALGAGITILADYTSTLAIRADIAPTAAAGTIAVGVDSVDSKPSSATGGDMPLFGSEITIVPQS